MADKYYSDPENFDPENLESKTWVVDIDISAFFDKVNHDLLMAKVGRKIRDKQVLKLIGNFLRAPMERDGQKIKRSQGTPQGGPLSPLLANIYLDDLDKELESRGLNFCRYADDLVIYVSSERSGQRILASLAASPKSLASARRATNIFVKPYTCPL